MQSLLSKETPTNESGYDSDDDWYHYPFKPKERIDFLDQGYQAQMGQVETVLDEMVYCVSDNMSATNQRIVMWIAVESEKLAAPNSWSPVNEKRKWFNFYISLLKTLGTS